MASGEKDKDSTLIS
jgi:hypothetical protein